MCDGIRANALGESAPSESVLPMAPSAESTSALVACLTQHLSDLETFSKADNFKVLFDKDMQEKVRDTLESGRLCRPLKPEDKEPYSPSTATAGVPWQNAPPANRGK